MRRKGLDGRRPGLWRLTLVFALDVFWRRHEGHLGHRFRREPDDAGVDLGIDAPQERAHIEIEQGAVGRHHAVGLGPRWQGIERALLKRLHHLRARGELGREICFRQSASGTQIPK
jgi:hypothetical protein